MKLLLLLVMFSVLGVRGDEQPAQVQSEYGQLVTSSTLVWTRAGAGLFLPPGAVESGTGRGVVCRASRQGLRLLGETRAGRCWVVGEGGRLSSVSQYSILSHQTAASKLEWKSYQRFSPVPRGAVAGVETGEQLVFVARRLQGGLMVPAQLELKGFGGEIAVYSQTRPVRLEADCDVLVEVEPVRYELLVAAYTKEPLTTSDRRVLATSSMFRFQEGSDSVARMTKMLSYTYEKTLYFGHIQGTIKGLPTRVNLPTGEKKTITWGQRENDKQEESIMVGHNMEKNTAVDITVEALLVTEEQPWQGRLRAVFSDGSEREREVEGVTLMSHLDNIQPTYSVLYQIKEQEPPPALQSSSSSSSSSITARPRMGQETFEMLQNTEETSSGAVSWVSLRLLPWTILAWVR